MQFCEAVCSCLRLDADMCDCMWLCEVCEVVSLCKVVYHCVRLCVILYGCMICMAYMVVCHCVR